MAGAPLVYTPPAYNVANVLYGVGIVFYGEVGSSVPADQNLGIGQSWISNGWSYIGATDAGVTLSWDPSTSSLDIEEQPTPVAVVVDKASLQITFDLSEETLANVNLAYGNAGTIAVTSPGAGQPGKSVLSLSLNFTQIAVAVIGKNQNGYARVLEVPAMMSTGQVKTDYRRAAAQRMYPATFSAVCPFTSITWTDLTAIATS